MKYKANRIIHIIAVTLGLCFLALPLQAGQILLQSTTSTQNSGLYDYLLPLYTKQTGQIVRVVAVGTGKALLNGRRCNADALLIHAKEDEDAFVKDGFGLFRADVMYNDFVIIGPKDDPAGIADAKTAAAALTSIANAKTYFASRGDNSGTHKKELLLWEQAGIDPRPLSGSWYLETGAGMGATLNLSVEKNTYSLTDRGTWIAFGNKQSHRILFEGEASLFNQYGVIPISKEACPRARLDEALQFIDWLTGTAGQAAIAAFQLEGQQLFTPNAR